MSAPSSNLIGVVDGDPVDDSAVDALLSGGRAGPASGQDSARLRRWAAQVVLTHEVLHREVTAHPSRYPDSISVGRLLSHAGLVGSISAAALRHCPCGIRILASFARSTHSSAQSENLPHVRPALRCDITITGPDGTQRQHTVASSALAGPTGRRLFERPLGSPVVDESGQVVRLLAVRPRWPDANYASSCETEATYVRAFCDWLDRRFAETVTVAPGSEHPGDPVIADFIHLHLRHTAALYARGGSRIDGIDVPNDIDQVRDA